MKLIKPLTLAIALMLGTSFALDADARRSDREKEKAELTFPDATREEPEAKVTERLFKKIEKLQDIYQEPGREAEAMALADEIIANERANAYDRGFAMLLAGAAASSVDDHARAESYLSRAIETNALPNENHYMAMRALGAAYFDLEQWDKAQAIFKRLVDETQTKEPEYHKLLGAAYYYADQFDAAIEPLKMAVSLDTESKHADAMSMLMGAYNETDRGADAIALAEGLLQKNPDDKTALMNVAKLYANSDQDAKAVAVLEGARAKGLITTENDYRLLFATYWGIDKMAEAARTIQEGLDKKALPEDAETYLNLAQALYFSDDIPGAIEAARKGSPTAKDGELDLFLATVLNQEDRNAESIVAAKQAIAKGVKSPGKAWLVIARAEYYSENIAGARAAFQEAAKDPGTASQAREELAKLK